MMLILLQEEKDLWVSMLCMFFTNEIYYFAVVAGFSSVDQLNYSP